MNTVAELMSVTHRYGSTTALDNVSIPVSSGQMVGLIGPDGVGKSTLLGLVAGLCKMQACSVQLLDGDMADRSYRQAVCARIAYMPQGLGINLYPTLTVLEDIDFFGRLFGKSSTERDWRIDDLLRSTGLRAFAYRPPGKLSGGMKQKLSLCCSLIHKPANRRGKTPSSRYCPRKKATNIGLSSHHHAWYTAVCRRSKRMA